MADPRPELTRRSMVGGAGVAVAAGVGLTAAPDALADSRTAGTGPAGSTVVEFRGRIVQSGRSGEEFTGYGFLVRTHRLSSAQLFTSEPDVGSALFTAYATGVSTARVLDQSAHSLDIEGDLTVFQRTAPGADFDDPASFRVGRPVAGFRLTLQDVLAVFAPQQGIPTLAGDMVQIMAQRLAGGSSVTFGRRGQRLRMFATGLGRLVDPGTLSARLEIAATGRPSRDARPAGSGRGGGGPPEHSENPGGRFSPTSGAPRGPLPPLA